MKKEIYTKPEIEIIEFTLQDVMTASGSYDPDGILDDNKVDSWWG